MTLQKLCCPSCGANTNIDIDNGKVCYCAYCGAQIFVNTGEQRITKTYNFNFNDNYLDDRQESQTISNETSQQNEQRKNDTDSVVLVLGAICVMLLLIGLLCYLL